MFWKEYGTKVAQPGQNQNRANLKCKDGLARSKMEKHKQRLRKNNTTTHHNLNVPLLILSCIFDSRLKQPENGSPRMHAHNETIPCLCVAATTSRSHMIHSAALKFPKVPSEIAAAIVPIQRFIVPFRQFLAALVRDLPSPNSRSSPKSGRRAAGAAGSERHECRPSLLNRSSWTET